ncbi:NADP-dependent oxidoreductase [Ornithinimicrobium avium]|uniref:NADP-dependent oxidoreductase n=2 Tax=Ornithinimicrobium avium TaxID=2283195 RepID=A0A345NKB3_9MICO|nr:NADP-dependent oxidoreductase [Ornithinimicrobium avium]
MRAVRLDEYGDVGVLQVREVDIPVPQPDRVVVEVVATSINPGEAGIREGGFDPDRTAAFPMGEGSDLAGRISGLGTGVTGWQVGDEVIGWSGERSAHAQYVAVPASQITARPEQVPWEQAGSLYVAGGTAVAMRDAVTPQQGESVVVTAAAGGVGSILVQLLVSNGVRVLGVAGPDKDDWLRGVGVEPVNRGEDLAGRLRAAAPEGVAAFLDCFGQGYTDLALGLGVPPERVVTIADFEAAGRNGARGVFGHASTTADTLADLAAMIVRGDLVVPIAATYPLDEVRAAYTALAERRTGGKIVLLP